MPIHKPDRADGCAGLGPDRDGRSQAVLDIETSARGMADAIAARQGKPGSAYVNYRGQDLPW